MAYPETLHTDAFQAVVAVGKDDFSEIVRYDFFKDGEKTNSHFSRLTNCCRATAKGTEAGIACRACYQPIHPEFGAVYDEAEVERMLKTAMEGAK